VAKTRHPRRQAPEVQVEEARESGPERWARWKQALDSGEVASRAELARREGVSRAAVTQGLRKLMSCPGGGDEDRVDGRSVDASFALPRWPGRT
jgi:hypothetical protein